MSTDGFRRIKPSEIVPSRHQPRKRFDEAKLAQLADSLRTHGLVQPVAVRPLRASASQDAPAGAQWELIAGERRWRAAQLAGLTEIPAVVHDLDEPRAAEWGLLENVQREDLDPMERAWAMRRLLEDFGLSQQSLAQRVGLRRSTVANAVRLTDLEPEIQRLLADGALDAGHGKALLTAPRGALRGALAERAAAECWSVRRLEKAAAQATTAPASAPQAEAADPGAARRSVVVADLERRISDRLGAKAKVRLTPKGAGRVEVAFYDPDHLEGLLERLGVDRG